MSNIKCRKYVEQRTPFKGNNLFGEKRGGDVYIVFSYGYRWPLRLYKDGQWYGHKSRYSVSTSKHRSQSMPFDIESPITILDDVQQLKDMI